MSFLKRIITIGGPIRFRDPERDRATDAARFGSVRESIAGALAGIDSEIAGLSRRRTEALDRASCLIGTADANEYGREQGEEERLREAEAQIRNANERLTSLHAQKLAFSDLDSQLVQAIPKAAPGHA